MRYDCDTATVALQTTITEKSVKNWRADLLVAGNHKPSLKSVDEAIRRRLHLIPFVVAIPPVERDKGLTEKSTRTSARLSVYRPEDGAVLAWELCP